VVTGDKVLNTTDTKDTKVKKANSPSRSNAVTLSRLLSLRRARLTVVASCLALACVALGAAQAPPRRIISLVPAITQMLFAIGAGPNVVAVSSFDSEPEAVQALPKVGALLDPDVERILSLEPDLVAIYGSQDDLRSQLDRARIPFFDYRHGGLAGIMATIRALGTRTGHVAAATKVADDIEQRLAAIKARTAGRPRLRTLLVFGREPESLRNVYASGARGFLNDLLDIAGGTNVFSDIDAESVQPSSEQILARAPEVILEIRAVGLTPAGAPIETASWNTLASVPAVRQRRVFVLAGSQFVVPGPRVAETAERMARALHPELF
jgi:iron complex transport system substrate-binding protein